MWHFFVSLSSMLKSRKILSSFCGMALPSFLEKKNTWWIKKIYKFLLVTIWKRKRKKKEEMWWDHKYLSQHISYQQIMQVGHRSLGTPKNICYRYLYHSLLVLLYTVPQALNILVTIPEKEKKENLVDKIFSIKWPPGEN